MTLKEFAKLLWALDGVGLISDYDIIIAEGNRGTIDTISIDFNKRVINIGV